jgi:predicted RNA-binding Zn-ribbon protein involved in translation (DUF1610 family)
MSRPVTDAERAQEARTLQAAGPADNVVSTACPECGTRFAVVAKYARTDAYPDGTWNLRCTLCAWRGTGELK